MNPRSSVWGNCPIKLKRGVNVRRFAATVVALFLIHSFPSPASAQVSVPGQTPAPPRVPQIGARDNATQKTGTSVLRGRVVMADTGRPLAKAQVRLSGAELREGRAASTDAEGTYEFKELPAGRYTISATKAGYVQLQYGQLRAFESGKPVDLRDGQTLDKLDFALPRGSVITGRVVDELGEPVMDVQVSAMRYQIVQGSRRLAPTGRRATTNDIGEFRIFGLLPGQYYVGATAAMDLMSMAINVSSSGLEVSDNRSGYAATYFPGTTRAAEAQQITLTLGQTLNDLTIQLSPTRTSRVSGSFVGSDGRPVTSGSVMAMIKDDPTAMPAAPAMIRPDGTFTLTGLTPGDYSIMGVAINLGGGGGIGGMETAMAPVTIAGDDITGVHLAATKPVTVTGRLIVDPAQQKALPVSAVQVMTIPADGNNMAMVGAMTPAKVNDDLTFEMAAVPGQVLFRLAGTPGQFAIKSVRLGAEEVVDSGVTIRPGENLSGIEIELTNQATTFVGAVTDSKGQPSKDYSVVVFSQDPKRWVVNTRHVSIGRPDQEGRYRVRIPAGQYYVVALDYLEPGEQTDAQFLERLRDLATTTSVNQSETKMLDLRITAHP